MTNNVFSSVGVFVTNHLSIAIAAIGLLLVVGTARAEELSDGIDAYSRGDYVEALNLFRVAAEQGNSDARLILGLVYANGDGVPEDYAEAVKWFRLAAEQGHAMAQYNLGLGYANGKGVPENDAEAVKWYRLAAEQGNVAALSALGFMYYAGEGVPENYTIAHMLFNLASTKVSGLRSDIIKRMLDDLSKRMTPNDISRAQGMARVCFENNYKGCEFSGRNFLHRTWLRTIEAVKEAWRAIY